MTTPSPSDGAWQGQRQPWPQQGYGYPQPPQQQYPGGWHQAPPPPPGKSKKFLFWLIPLIVVVVAAAVVIPIALAGGAKPREQAAQPPSTSAPAANKVKWRLSGLEGDVPEYKQGVATWLYEDTLVVVRDKYVAAFTRANGERRWLTEVPAGKRACGASVEPVDGKIAFAYGEEKTCDNAALIDLKDGKLGWQQPMEVPQKLKGDRPPKSAILQIAGDAVFVTQGEGMASLDLATGAPKWAKTHTREPDQADDPTCAGQDAVPRDGKIIVAMTCLTGEYGLSMLRVDASTGNIEVAEHQPKESSSLGNVGIISAKPLLVYGKTTDTGTYFRFGDDLKLASKIDGGDPFTPDGLTGADGQGFDSDASGTEHLVSPALVTEEVLYTITMPQAGTVNALVAVDLKTGQRKWSAKVPEGTVMAPLAIEDGQVITEVAPVTRTGPQRVVKVAVADGAVTPMVEAPIENADNDKNGPIAGLYRNLWADGRVYAVSGRFPKFSLDIYTVEP
ncbi:PQQ-binding-like beta-propeller repeat protein [Amycolatopsis orientalis]|uniref:outer membrane protein assembly factor BamB family protein n=1 Tax=Amycolatopsis orientalis TaxID=31958 RepID=UPI0009F6BA3F|nr:PQQ-binding-like beta-propeller repeat protein [Amycolatopsis orientalis]